MKTKDMLKISMVALVAAVLSNCSSTSVGLYHSGSNGGQDSSPHYVPASNGKGGIVLAPEWR